MHFDLRSVAIISNNCWGSGFYQENGVRYNTPFVGLYMNADDYLALLQNFRRNITLPLTVNYESRLGIMSCPVGRLGDTIEIIFLHYTSCEEAKEKWLRRSMRLPQSDDDLLFKVCDRDGFQDKHISLFEKLKYRNKIGFIKKGRFLEFDTKIFREIECDGECCPSGTELFDITRKLNLNAMLGEINGD